MSVGMGVGSWGGLHDVASTRYRRLPLRAVCVNRISMVETTTTTIEKGDRSSTISYQRVVRGKIYPRNGYALAYVGSHRFTLRKGQVFFNNTVCGTYDKKGYGKINDKLIQVIKSDQPYYLLVELKAAD